MKKTLIAVSFIAALITTSAKAQTLQEGINHLYADRFASAVQVFQKLLAVNPNLMEANYWLGQTYLDMDENDAARLLYDKSLQLNGNAPLYLVGRGHVHLLDKKIEPARQMFDAAIAISKTRKGDDPSILNAVGRANVDAKEGNFQYAIQVLELALQRDPKNSEIALNLGNAYRKANPGSGGGKAYEYYQMAVQLNPKFAYPYLRIAKLFETQKNWEFVLENLNKSVQVDPTFSLGYYELFYYYFFRQNYVKAEENLNSYIQSKAPEVDVQDDYLYAQLCWAKKDYACAISKAQNVENTMGAKTKPKVYKLLAVSFADKGDTTGAKPYIDKYFTREKPEDIISFDLILKGRIYGATSGDENVVFDSYIQASALDSVYTDKIKTLQDGADYFKAKGNRVKAADMQMVIYRTRTIPDPTRLIFIGIDYMQAGNLNRADSLFNAYNIAFPDSIYGYSYRGRINYNLDTTMTVEPYISRMIQNYEKSLSIAINDRLRLKSHGITAARALAIYYVNVRNSHDTALVYAYKGLEIDSTDIQLKYIKEILEKSKDSKQSTNPAKPPSKTNNKPVSSIRKPTASNTNIARN